MAVLYTGRFYKGGAGSSRLVYMVACIDKVAGRGFLRGVVNITTSKNNRGGGALFWSFLGAFLGFFAFWGLTCSVFWHIMGTVRQVRTGTLKKIGQDTRGGAFKSVRGGLDKHIT